MSTIISTEQEKLGFHKSLKIVLFPTESQKELFIKTFGCCRQIYNNRLSEKQDFYIDNILTIPKDERKSKSVEDLSLKGMIQGSKNAKNYVDVSWSTFVSKLQDKGKTFGCEVVKADRFFASSQTCSNCGFKYPEVQKKHLQNWTCQNYGISHQRDVNAAINLKNYIPTEHRKFTTMDFVERLARQALAVSGAEDEVVTWKAMTKKNPIGL